jgi:hypothetical protein
MFSITVVVDDIDLLRGTIVMTINERLEKSGQWTLRTTPDDYACGHLYSGFHSSQTDLFR